MSVPPRSHLPTFANSGKLTVQAQRKEEPLGADDDSPRSRQTHVGKPSRVLLPDCIRHSHAQPAALRYSPTSHLGREKHGARSTTSVRRKKGQDPENYPVDENSETLCVEPHSEARSTLKRVRARFFFIGKMVRSNTVLFIVITIVSVDLGAYAGYRIGSAMSSKVSGVEARNERVTTVDAVFEQAQAQGTLVCASKSYDLYSKVESSNRDLLNLLDVPFTKKRTSTGCATRAPYRQASI